MATEKIVSGLILLILFLYISIAFLVSVALEEDFREKHDGYYFKDQSRMDVFISSCWILFVLPVIIRFLINKYKNRKAMEE